MPGKLLVVVAVVLSLSGCATMNRGECETADWQAIGYEDGAGGKALSYLGNHRKACAEYGITPDMTDYEQGRQAGLQEYCVPRTGYALGKSGKALNSVCPQPLAGDFEGAWREGQQVHQAESQQRSSERALSRQQREAQRLEARIAEVEKQLVSDGISSEQRKKLLDELKNLSVDLVNAELELPGLEEQLAIDRQRADQVRSRYEY